MQAARPSRYIEPQYTSSLRGLQRSLHFPPDLSLHLFFVFHDPVHIVFWQRKVVVGTSEEFMEQTFRRTYRLCCYLLLTNYQQFRSHEVPPLMCSALLQTGKRKISGLKE